MINQSQQETPVLARAIHFAETCAPIIEAVRQMAEALKALAVFQMPDIQSAKWYELAGRPYGNHTRGKKRWLREMKHS